MKTAWIQLRVDQHMKARIEAVAKRHGVSVTALMMLALVNQYPEVMEPDA